MVDQILLLYGIQPGDFTTELFGDGLINHTWKVKTATDAYILQRVNDHIFQAPFVIDQNLRKLQVYLNEQHPGYTFVGPLPALTGDTLLQTDLGYFRLFPYVVGSHAINTVTDIDEAFEAAKQFGQFSRLLNDFDVNQLGITLPDFHNLSLRYQQFLQACEKASGARKAAAADAIAFIFDNRAIVTVFEEILEHKKIPLRVIHHDTKISNVLFDEQNKGICVIDLDTVMPGYFISDLGDMMRTYLSAANEEETDFEKVAVRPEFVKAIYDGYLSEMGDVLTATEKNCFMYAGKFIIFMQAIRFLTDYLQNDSYYGSKYENHNLNRALNQITLLVKLQEIESDLKILLS